VYLNGGATSLKPTAFNHDGISLLYINQGIDIGQSTNARSCGAMSTRDDGDVYDKGGWWWLLRSNAAQE
jgi:hypothetical protein